MEKNTGEDSPDHIFLSIYENTLMILWPCEGKYPEKIPRIPLWYEIVLVILIICAAQ
jgi:hypothetical protein